MRLYKRADIWWLGWFENGREFRKSTKCTDKKAAQLVFNRVQRERADPTHAAAHSATVASAAARFLKEKRKTCRSDGTLNMYECKTGHVVRLLGEVRLSELSHAKVLEYTERREAETASPHTVHRELTALRLLLKSAARAGEFGKDIKSILPSYSARYEPRTRWLTEDEMLAVCEHLEPSRAAVIAFMLATSARFSEAFRARRGDIQATGIVIRGTKTARAKRVVPAMSMFWPYLAFAMQHADGPGELMFSPWTNLRRDVARASHRAGLASTFTPNDLRRSTATWLVKRGVPLNLIAKVMGHASTAMLERVYGQLDHGDVGRLIEMHAAQ